MASKAPLTVRFSDDLGRQSSVGRKSTGLCEDDLQHLLCEASNVIAHTAANTLSPGRPSVFRGWCEVRGLSKRFYSWKRRFLAFDSRARRLTLYKDEREAEAKGSYVVTDVVFPRRVVQAAKSGREPAFYQRRFRIDVLVTDGTRSPLAVNLFSGEELNSWFRILSAATAAPATPTAARIPPSPSLLLSPAVVAAADDRTVLPAGLSEMQLQVAALSDSPQLKKLLYDVSGYSLRRVNLAEWAKYLAQGANAAQKADKPLQKEESLKLLSFADASLARRLSTGRPEFNVFLSSGERQFLLETTLINADVFPYLRALGRAVGVEVNLPVDLSAPPRHLVNEHALESLRGLEIKACKKTSKGLCYVQLLGDRYGPNALPSRIEAGAFEGMMCAVEEGGHLEQVVLMSKWYSRDDNARPPEYKLQPIDSLIPSYGAANEDVDRAAVREWQNTVDMLQESLHFASEGHLEQDWSETYMTSEVHSELKQGILQRPEADAAKYTIAYLREFQLCDLKGPVSLNCYYDIKEKQDSGRFSAVDDVRQARLNKLKVALANSGAPSVKFTLPDPKALTEDASTSYMNLFLDRFCSTCVNSVLQISKSSSCVLTALESDVAGHLAASAAHQMRYEAVRSSENFIKGAMTYVDNASDSAPLYMHGRPGAGKTAAIAELLNRLHERNGETGALVCVRFIGSGHSSRSYIELLSSVCEQIGILSDGESSKELPHTFEELCNEFPRRLKALSENNKELIVIFDGVDEVSDYGVDDPSMFFSWIPDILPPGIKLIITGDSTSPRHSKILTLVTSSYEMGLWSVADASKFIVSKLEARGRTITKEQRIIVEKGLSDGCTALVATLALHEVASWPSHMENLEEIVIPNDADAIIEHLLEKLEKRHKDFVVKSCFGYINCAAEGGLSSNELLDVLSLDDDVLDKLETFLPPGSYRLTRRFPTIIWKHLLQDCVDILERRSTADGSFVWGWSHKKIGEVVGRRGRAEELKYHQNLADYFGGVFESGKAVKLPDGKSSALKINRFVDGHRLLGVNNAPNFRKLMEFPVHLCVCKEWDKLEAFMSDLNVLDVLGHRGTRRRQLRPGTGRAMLLQIWKQLDEEGGKDMCASYVTSLSVWDKSSISNARDMNRKLKSVGVFLKDAGEEFRSMRCIAQASDVFAHLLQREKQEFGDTHPATVSTARMLEGCKLRLAGKTPNGRKGSVGMTFIGGDRGGGVSLNFLTSPPVADAATSSADGSGGGSAAGSGNNLVSLTDSPPPSSRKSVGGSGRDSNFGSPYSPVQVKGGDGDTDSDLQKTITPIALEKKIRENSPFPISPIANVETEASFLAYEEGGAARTENSWMVMTRGQYDPTALHDSGYFGNENKKSS